ncbi:hypothetical protein D3C72_1633570 [compost metagenome]
MSVYRLRAASHLVQVLIQIIDRLGQVLKLLIQVTQLLVLVLFLQDHFLTLQPFEQLIQINRLLVIVGNPGAQRLDHVLLVGAAGEHDRFECTMLARQSLQLLHQLDPVHARHVQIAQHQTDIEVLLETLDGLMAGLARNTAVTLALQKFTQFFNDH